MDFVNDNDNPTLAEMMKKVEHIVTAPENTDCDTAYGIMKDKKVCHLISPTPHPSHNKDL